MGRYGNYPNPELCNKYGCYKSRNNFGMGCTGCNLSQVEKQNQKTKAYKDGLIFCDQIKKLVVLYEDDEGHTKFMEAEAARNAGVRITGYIPYVPDLNNG